MVVFYYSVPTYLICSPPVISVILHQGSQSAAEYSIDFRILAAESGWNLAPSPARYPTLCQHPKASHIRPDSRELFPPPPPVLCFQSAVPLLWSAQTLPRFLPGFAERTGSPLEEGTLVSQTSSNSSPLFRLNLPGSLLW